MKVKKKKTGFFARAAMKKKDTTSDKPKTIDAQALNQKIQQRAYFLWEELGQPQGQDFDIWVKAEKDVCGSVEK